MSKKTDSPFRGKNILVMGAGLSGLSAARLLLDSGAAVTLTDIKSKEELSGQLTQLPDSDRLKLHLGGHRDSDFNENEIIVISPGIPSGHPLIRRARVYGARVISEIELAYQFINGAVFAITGTNGKTTTTNLTGEIFKQGKPGAQISITGNIGYPLTTAVLENPETDYFITEISSFQLENIDRFKSSAAVVLNVTPDHMDRYNTVKDYARAKAEIFKNQTEQDWALINLDADFVELFKSCTPANILEFSTRSVLDRGIWLDNDFICINLPRLGIENLKLININEIILKGLHNIENIMAAVGLSLAAGIAPDSITETLSEFRGLPHRVEFIANINGVEFYNDSKATNVDAVIKAVEMFRGRPLILILGGSDKNLDFTPLLKPVVDNCTSLILIGETAPKLETVFKNKIEYKIGPDMETAVNLAYSRAIPDKAVVLLSPACASFDWFNNYKHRGDVFRGLVNNLQVKEKKC